MPHYLESHRDEIDGMIGPIEELVAKANAIVLAIGSPPEIMSVIAELNSAINTLEETRNSIDEYEEDKPEEDEEADEEIDEEAED